MISKATKQIKCLFCGKDVPEHRRFLCSTICAKRRYAIKQTVSSRYGDDSKYNETNTGKSVFWEGWFVNTFGGEWMNEEIMGKPYDVLWNGKKIDIKVAEYYVRTLKRGKKWNGGGVWNFHQNPFLKPEIDFYACICLKNNLPVKLLLVPAAIYDLRKGLTIGINSQFNIYNIL